MVAMFDSLPLVPSKPSFIRKVFAATYPNCWKLLKTLLLNSVGNNRMDEIKLVYSKNVKYETAENAVEIDNQQPSL